VKTAEPRSFCCEECGREHRAGERACRAYLTVDDEVAIYCPDCADREFQRTWARTSAPSLMLRTASAKPFPAASAEDGIVIAAGMSAMVASSRKSGMPRSRARTEA
jgi:hypothetical protein